MEAITVVRVEKDGIGVFHSSYTNSQQPFYRAVVERHREFPTPDEEDLKMGLNWYCAYKTVDELRSWIKVEELQGFVDIGFRVYMLEVTDYQVGEYQAIFTKDSILTKTDITNIFIN